MIKSKIPYFIIGLLLAFILLYSFSGNHDAGKSEDLGTWRTMKDQYFREEADSPLTEDQKKEFRGLIYFEENPDFRIIADWHPLNEKDVLTLKTTNDGQRAYWKYGIARFMLNDTPCELLVLKPVDIPDQDYLFLPFYDNTSGLTTYGGGRYVEPDLMNSGKILIDFNRAYNPYCAYNKKYRCPIPPLQNNIKVAVEAGEKNFDF